MRWPEWGLQGLRGPWRPHSSRPTSSEQPKLPSSLQHLELHRGWPAGGTPDLMPPYLSSLQETSLARASSSPPKGS